ncbi:MAG: carotenoid 1,2-hydratase [Polyangiaceae bacterium]|nr:carotenoid 1,2-hydratase [Polyangiaceae bacterium]
MIIGMLGNVFSPAYYAARKRKRGVAALDHCTMNVALYDRRSPRWALTETAGPSLSPQELRIGASAMRVEGSTLVVTLDENTSPFPGRIRGEVRVELGSVEAQPIHLDRAQRHRWTPLAAHARCEVTLTEPSLRFRGAAYLDSNAGDEPLESAFSAWSWSRATLSDGRTIVSYDVTPRHSEPGSILLQATPASLLPLAASIPCHILPRTRFGIAPRVRMDTVGRIETLEDTPFYARSRVHGRLFGEPAVAVHEELCLDRFQKQWVQFLLPFRMRRGRAPGLLGASLRRLWGSR